MQKTNSFKTLQRLHVALLLGQIAFVAIAIFLIKCSAILPVFAKYDKAIQTIVLLYSATVCYVGMQIYFKNKIYGIRDTDATIAEKFTVYKKASVVQWACIGSAGILSTLCFLLVGNYSFIALAFTLIFLFTIMGVNKAKLMLLLKFTEVDIAQINSN
jgi:hypothetical protein